MVVQHPDRFTGIGTVSLENFTIKRALKQIEDCVELGMIGLSIEPAFFNMTLDEKKLYPIYAKAMENNLLVALHTGINYTTHQPMAGENPILLDQIACDFPDLNHLWPPMAAGPGLMKWWRLPASTRRCLLSLVVLRPSM